MNLEQQKQISIRMTTRAATGLYFIQDFLYDHSAKDGAYFRSLCILLSYSFELLIKAEVVLTSEYSDITALKEQLRDLNHNLITCAKKLGAGNLEKIGLKSITARDGTDFIGYTAETVSGKKITIENFIDIRYDFTNPALRSLPEDNEFTSWVDESLKIYGNIKKLHY